MKFVLILAAVVLMVASVSAQSKIGIGMSVTESSPNVSLRTWTTNSLALEPSLAMTRISRGGQSLTFWDIGFGILMGRQRSDAFRSYQAFRIGADMASGGGSTYTDMSLAVGMGGEYFFSDHFSVGGEVDLGVIFTDDTDSPNGLYSDATYITTAQMLTAHFYF